MEINLKEYIHLIRKRLWLIALIVLASTLLTSMYTNRNFQPVYEASTKLIVNSTLELDQLGTQQIDYGAIGINIGLINTYKEIIKTPAIMDKVVQRYPDLNLSSEQLISMVNVSGLNDTQVMTIVVRSFSYELSVKIANAVTEVFRTEIPKIMKVDNITILNNAKLKEHPSPVNKKSSQMIVLSFAGSLAAAVGLILLLEAMDDTLKTDDDIRRVFEMPTLAVIPKMNRKDLRNSRKTKSRNPGDTPYAAASR